MDSYVSSYDLLKLFAQRPACWKTCPGSSRHERANGTLKSLATVLKRPDIEFLTTWLSLLTMACRNSASDWCFWLAGGGELQFPGRHTGIQVGTGSQDRDRGRR